ncbi:MAG: PPC domain-containing DNA-binding protein [Desulfovibrionaceae bacterium]
MQVAQGSLGRVFVLRLEDGDRLPDSLERFAADNHVQAAFVALLGGVASGSLVVGPKDSDAAAIVPVLRAVAGAHEAAAVGTLFPDATGAPRLHMHAALGRGDDAPTGCVRRGLDIWKIAEAVVIELLDTGMVRTVDPAFGFEVLTAAPQEPA